MYYVYVRCNDGVGWVLVDEYDNALSATAEACAYQLDGYDTDVIYAEDLTR